MESILKSTDAYIMSLDCEDMEESLAEVMNLFSCVIFKREKWIVIRFKENEDSYLIGFYETLKEAEDACLEDGKSLYEFANEVINYERSRLNQ